MEEGFAYESLAEELASAGVVLSVAEVHGGMCGVMCVGGAAAANRWLDEQLEEWRQPGDSTVGEVLHALEDETWRTLNASDMSFEPLLPGDEQPLDSQVRALASWCQGFLGGLGLGGLTMTSGSSDVQETVSEITKDFSEISRAALGEEDTSDLRQAGFALEELKEYVRVSVQLLFEHFGGHSGEPGGSTIH